MEFNLLFDPKLSPKFMGIWDGYNELMKKWNKLNNEMHTLQPRLIGPARIRKRLSLLTKDVKALQRQWLDHQNAAIDFALAPELRLAPQTKQDVTFLLLHAALRDRIGQFRHDMGVILDNLNRINSELNYVVSIRVAFCGLGLSLIGLTLSLVL